MKYKEKSLFQFWELPKNKNLTSKAKELRKGGILSEVLFWQHFKNKELIDGWDIDRQVIIGNYIVDFFIAELGMIIEIDGSTHDFKYDYDKVRDSFFDSYELEVIHIKDIEVKRNIDGVHKFILEQIRKREAKLKMNNPPRF
jgi:very-short-patch-repair endonuclease